MKKFQFYGSQQECLWSRITTHSAERKGKQNEKTSDGIK